MRYEVQKVITLTVAVEADNDEEALGAANELLLDDWDKHDTITVDITPVAGT